MTRAEMLTQLAYRTNKSTGTLDATTKARLIGFLDDRQRILLSMPGAQHLRDEVITLASVVDQYRYGLANVAKVIRVTDATNRRPLSGLTIDQWRMLEPDPTSITGTPNAWAWLGYQPVAQQPADASELFVKSTSAADTTQTVFVDVLISGQYPRTLSVTLTGTTAVSLGASVTTAVVVTKFYLSAVGAGTITLHEDSGLGTELARIGIGQTQQRYYSIILSPTPSEIETYTLDVTLALVNLAQDTDTPRLPEDFHDLMIKGALMDEYEHLHDERLSVAAARYHQRLREFKYWMHSTAAEPTSIGPRIGTGLGLPGWYPQVGS